MLQSDSIPCVVNILIHLGVGGLKHQAFNDNVYIFKTYLTFTI